MNNGKSTVLSVAIASLAIIVCTLIISKPVTGFLDARQSIAVTGSAKKQIVSDLAVWTGNFSVQAADTKTAYALLKDAAELVKAYLVREGIPEQDIMFSSVFTETRYETDPKSYEMMLKGFGVMPNQVVSGYVLRQNVEIRSDDVEKIAAISRESTELLNEGVMFQSNPAQFFYTKLNELKVDMLAEASNDALARAEKIVTATGSSIGHIKSARMGVFQITQLHSNEVTDYGINDTWSLEKEITAVVNCEFTIK